VLIDTFRGAFSGVGATISPFAQRTQQFVRESLGQSEDKVSLTYTSLVVSLKLIRNQTELPSEYVDLEKRVDALKAAHQKMLAVT
jgi:hypothetical protein